MNSFWEFFWLMASTALFLGYLIVLFQIVGDLLRDRSMSGGAKAVWVFGLVLVPLLTALVYLVARGGGMYARQEERQADAQQGVEQYIKSVAGTRSPAADIADAKLLLDAETITQSEYEALKVKALA